MLKVKALILKFNSILGILNTLLVIVIVVLAAFVLPSLIG